MLFDVTTRWVRDTIIFVSMQIHVLSLQYCDEASILRKSNVFVSGENIIFVSLYFIYKKLCFENVGAIQRCHMIICVTIYIYVYLTMNGMLLIKIDIY